MTEFDTNASDIAEYQQGFNDSYQLAKHLPELSESLSYIEQDTPFLLGFKDGREEFIHEFEKERYPEWLRRERFKTYEKGMDMDKDRGIEKEMDGPE